MTHAATPAEPYWLARTVDDLSLWACAAYAAVILVMPPEGIAALELCPSVRWTQAPCPGCGMTRCGANLVRGRLRRAADYHPAGVVIVPLLFVAGAVGLLPRRCREAFRRGLLRRRRLAGRLGALLLGCFLVFGCARWWAVRTGRMSFPAVAAAPDGRAEPRVAGDNGGILR
jgi:hypothetical protein